MNKIKNLVNPAIAEDLEKVLVDVKPEQVVMILEWLLKNIDKDGIVVMNSANRLRCTQELGISGTRYYNCYNILQSLEFNGEPVITKFDKKATKINPILLENRETRNVIKSRLLERPLSDSHNTELVTITEVNNYQFYRMYVRIRCTYLKSDKALDLMAWFMNNMDFRTSSVYMSASEIGRCIKELRFDSVNDYYRYLNELKDVTIITDGIKKHILVEKEGYIFINPSEAWYVDPNKNPNTARQLKITIEYE